MLTKLIALLKKDAILATRSIVWTLFELLLPVVILFVVTAFMGQFADIMSKAMDEMKGKTLVYTVGAPIIFGPPTGICDGKIIPTSVFLRNGDDVTFDLLHKKKESFTLSNKEIKKKLGDCEEVILCVDISGKDIKINVAASMGTIPIEDLKSPMQTLSDAYMFSGVIIEAVLQETDDSDKGKGWSKAIHVEEIDVRKVDVSEIALPYFFLIIGISMAVTVINVARNVVTEKSTVKPYLSAIGLPGWMFYTEHFIATILKSFITCIGAMWYFKGIEYASLGVLMLGAIFYMIGAISFSLLISSFFTNAKRGIEASLIAWFFLVCFPLSQDEGDLSVLHSLNINYAYHFFLLKAQQNALANNKMTFGELFNKEYVDGTAAGIYLLMVVVDAIWMFAATLLVDKYGEKLASVKDLFKSNGRAKGGGHEDRDVILEGCIENEKTRNQAVSDVELKNVVKVYPTGEKAVNGLSFRAIRGQVSILLGQNGCGKSTTFSMISGVALPTSGSIKVAGVDAVRQKDKARKFIGFCPQYNPLYDRLTVLEHLELVNALKEGPPNKFMAEAKQLLQAIRLADKTGTHASKLSGGMKRKLCVCMAMIGGSKVVLLDEPTAGMDPGARKDVQLMLEKIKVNRTILLTTHYMDEAERLGDWVFVMSYGRMAASGSLNYLKKKFGSGYVLTVVLDVKSDRKYSTKLVESICSHIVPRAQLKDQRGQMIEMTLPEEEKAKVLPLLKTMEDVIHKKYTSKNVKNLPEKLKEKIKRLRVTTLGLSLSSLETVFIRICDECDIAIAREKNLEDKRAVAEESYEKLMKLKRESRVSGSSLQSSQFTTLIRKKYYYTIRNIYQLLFQLIIPVAIVVFGLHMVTLNKSEITKTSETLDLNILPKCVAVMMKGDKADNYDEIKRQLEGHKKLKVKEEPLGTDHQKLITKYYKDTLGFVVEVNDGVAKIFYNKRLARAAPVLTILATNWFVKDGGWSLKLEWLISDTEKASNEFMLLITMAFFVTLAFALVTAPYVQFSIEERVCKFSHQQHLTGMNRMIFWSASIVWDSLIYIFFCAASIICFVAFKMFTNVINLILMMYGIFLLAILPITYVASLIFESATKASTLLILYQIVVGGIAVTALMLMILAKSNSAVMTVIFYTICPPSAFMFGFFKALISADLKNPDGMAAQFVDYKTIWEWKGIIRDIFFLSLSSIIFTVIVYAMQNRSTRVAIFDMRHKVEKPIPKKPVKALAPCKAVGFEEQLVRRGRVKECTVVVKDLVRVFGKFRAVNGLCVTVRNNECFGLLGTNGAGKTTTFDILTGLRFPSGGSATIDGKDVVRHNYVGYCPQFDSILPDLKCIEALEIMAQLHGYTEPKLAVNYVLKCVGMVEHCQKHFRMCSGGQKRKISVGVAMLTRARCIMMDEPTAGIDPRARREIWEILDWMREKSGSSIVLTSHSMEECEALCSRIAILRKGEMIALGTSQDLKSQYGNTYTMTIMVNKISDRERVCREVHRKMPEAVLKTAMTNITTSLVWELPKRQKDKWSKKYEKVQKLARKLHVKDFMLTQSSLEDTFINLTD
ncbi:unnamed protein product [Caenorhabditis sp. 36 PRJEB53466]|nr:unnamed protein product [Caenorhabditis sp. 36 PRJEB53466]